MNEETNDSNNNDEGGVLPITGRDVYVGATAQCHVIENTPKSSTTPRAWITTAMDATARETEMFQLSDVYVQMVHEGIIPSKSSNRRFIQATKPISIVAAPSPTST